MGETDARNSPLVGVDGGQSQTRVQRAGSPTVYELPGISRLEGDPDDTLVGLLHRAWTAHRLPPQARVVLGLTTLPASPAARDRLATRIATVTQARQVWLTDDRLTAHHAALGERVGVSLIAGTGVACTALTRSGRVRFFDGHGYLLGDEGAGFWIGRAGLAAVLHHRDGYGPPTALTVAARERFGDLAVLPEAVHAQPRAVDAIARFAVEVLAATDGGDHGGTALVGRLGQLRGDRVAPRVGDREEHVAGADRVMGEQHVGQAVQPLQRGAQRGVGVQHQALEQDRADPGQATGPVERLLGQQVRVPGAEQVHLTPAWVGLGHHGSSRLNGRPLGAAQPFQPVETVGQIGQPGPSAAGAAGVVDGHPRSPALQTCTRSP